MIVGARKAHAGILAGMGDAVQFAACPLNSCISSSIISMYWRGPVGRGKKIVDIELVVDEAVALIEEGGVEAFSTRRLASRLGISAMTLYNYYENRGAIREP